MSDVSWHSESGHGMPSRYLASAGIPVQFFLLQGLMLCYATLQERPGLVVLTIELEGALAQMPGNLSPNRMWSPYREPLAKFLNKYSVDVGIASVRLTFGQRLFLLYGRPSA